MIDQVRRYCRRWNLLSIGETVVVGVSGGADSLALLHLLSGWQHSLKLTLHVATLDHGLRGAAGAADADFVEHYCHDNNLDCTRARVDVSALAGQKRLGIEAAARLARYQFLGQTAQQIGATSIAVAHHADDQAETVLMHLLRGAGLRGLGGMLPSSSLAGFEPIRLIRPLLSVTRSQIEAYCTAHGLRPRHDATNADTAMLRNRLRLEILPQLESVNPRLRVMLTQLAESARVDDSYLAEQLRAALAPIVKREPDRVIVSRGEYRLLHPALQRRAIMDLTRQLDPTHEIDYLHVIEAVELASAGEQGGVALLGGGLQLRIDYADLVIEHMVNRSRLPGTILIPRETDLEIHPGENPIPDTHLILHLSAVQVAGNNLCLQLSPASQLRLRPRRKGDRVRIGQHSQKLSDWMINRKIPASIREQIPLLCLDGDIVALYWNGWQGFLRPPAFTDLTPCWYLRWHEQL
jgi:tRNA(Ile)-lysidine synthase